MKSGAGFPAGMYNVAVVGSSVKLLHIPPPVGGVALGPDGHVALALPVSGMMSNCHSSRPVAASSACTCPCTPILSPPALPRKTMPFQAMGAIGAPSPSRCLKFTDQSTRPVAASSA